MSPIESCRDWPTLFSALDAAAPDAIGGLPESVAAAVLAGPSAIAMWLAHRGAAVAAKPKLSILLLGAEATDVPDEGRWYQLLPALLGRSFEVELTCVGLEIDTGFASSAADRAPGSPARTHRMSIAQFLEHHPDAPIDLAIAFHPGLQKHRAWLAADGFPKLLERGIPLVCAAYAVDEYEMERWIVEAYGYRAGASALVNPCYLDLSGDGTSIRWGHVLWQIESAPPGGAVIDRERLAALDTLNRMVMHSIALGHGPTRIPGETVELSSSGGDRLTLVHVFDDRFVNRATGEVVRLDQGRMERVKRLPAEALETWPGSDAREIERAVWAAGVKSRYLMDSYPASAAADERGLAAAMLDRMRRRAASLFRGRRDD